MRLMSCDRPRCSAVPSSETPPLSAQRFMIDCTLVEMGPCALGRHISPFLSASCPAYVGVAAVVANKMQSWRRDVRMPAEVRRCGVDGSDHPWPNVGGPAATISSLTVSYAA